MINTAPPALNSVFQVLGRLKNGFDIYNKTNFSYQVCHCGAVVKELLARTDRPGSTPGDAAFCFFAPFFFFYLLLTLLIMHIDQYIFYA